MSVPPVYPCPLCGHNFITCSHGPNALTAGISQLSLEAIEQTQRPSLRLDPNAPEFVPRFSVSSHPPPPQQEEIAAGGGAEGGSVEGADYSSLGARPKARKQRPEESVVPQSLVYKALNIPGSPHCLEEGVQFFSKDAHSIEEVVLNTIQAACNSIRVRIYHMSSEVIMQALKDRIDEGLDVLIYYQTMRDDTGIFADDSYKKLLKTRNVSTSFQHKKEIIVDGQLALMGTMNFSYLSLNCDPNCLIKVYSPRLCSLMKQNLSGKCRVHGQELVYHSLYRNGPDISLEIIKAINAATSKIYVAMFIISHDAILEALDRAHRRGVNVVLIVDNIQKHTTFSILQKLGSKVKLLEYGDSGCLHCKICVIDGKDFIIGSANWSKRGFSGNLESVLFVKGMTPSQKEGVNKFWTHLLSYSHEVTPENVNIGRKRMLQQGEREEKEEN